ncbi:MAG: ribosome biogenesis GTPase Der [Patescibacteria group bacterium]|jgi:GTP-binding protein
MTKLPIVVIIGRINVGKSSLFNRLTETGKALVSKIPGTTRDYNLGRVNWQKKSFSLIDTGGVNIETLKNSIRSLLPDQNNQLKNVDTIEKEIVRQTKEAIAKADLILMVVDGQAGLMPEDKELALVVKKLKAPAMLVCNKIDNPKYQHQPNEFFALGLGRPWPVSAINGSGTGDFLDELIKKIKNRPGRPKKPEAKKPIKVAVIGKPNVGKSSLVNKILGENRVIVADTPQTTREPQDTEIDYLDEKIILIDTAGLRKKAKIKRGLEKMSTKKTLTTIKIADIVLFLTEVDQPLGKQDEHLAGLIKDAGAGVIVVANKWDLVPEKDEKTDGEIKKYYQRYFPYLSFAPLIFTSAKTGKNTDKILDVVLSVNQERRKEVPEDELKNILKQVVKIHYPA